MDLKDFIKETLIQITEGVKEAQDKCKQYGGLVNPMLSVKTCNDEKYHHDDGDYPATSVNFKVGLTESSNKGDKAGIGVFLGKVSLGKEGSSGHETQSVTSVEFSVTVVFPYINRDGKHVPISSLGID